MSAAKDQKPDDPCWSIDVTTLARTNQTTDLVSRLRRVLTAADLDCACRATLEAALIRFTSLEQRRQMRKALATAREEKDQIIARLAFLAELDEITVYEPDQTVFEEMALLFDEIRCSASEASKAIRIASVSRLPRHG